MELTYELKDTQLTVTVEGRLDTNTSPELEAFLRENLDGVQDLVIDLANTQYVSSAGLRVFLFAYKELVKVDGKVVLRSPNVYIADVLDATGFTDFITIES